MNSKRYTIGSKPATSGPPLTCMVEDGAGEWVKHEDHAEALAHRDKEHADLGKFYVLHSDHERVKAQLAEVTRQRDELVEAVLDDICFVVQQEKAVEIAARIQSGQPKGEWIDERDEMLSIPLRDGTRLKIGECFVATDTYPFFSDGEENYNARLGWCDTSKSLHYDIYPISDRVRGRAVGGSMEDIEWDRIDRRPDIPAYQPKEQRDEQ